MLTLLPDLNVAPLKFAHVLKEKGGPVRALSCRERVLAEGTYYEAEAYLEEPYAGAKPGPHGQGFAAARNEALYGALADAMIFWARATTPPAALGADTTRAGFAAYPGLGVQGAHKRALFAAAQRWNLLSWWAARLAHTELKAPGVTGLQIRSPIVGVCTVVAWEPRGQGAEFGAGTAATPAHALAAARLDLFRARFHPDARRAHFAGAAGYQAFQARAATGQVRVPPTPPRALVDTALTGPWTQYAHVWRCLFDEADFREKDKDETFLL